MSDELAQLFQSVRGDTMNTPLAEPGGIREEADRRRRFARTVAVAAVALVVGLVGGAAYALARPAAGPPAPPSTTTTPTGVPTPSPSPSQSESASPSGTPARAPGAGCRPGDLDPRPLYGGQGAAGTVVLYVAVRNVSGTPCRLRLPVILVDFSGTPTPIPTDDRSAKSGAPLELPPGQYAYFDVAHANGPVLPSTDPRCTQPGDYQHLALQLDDRLFPLPGFGLSWSCGEPRVGAWALVTDLDRDVPGHERAP